MKTSKMWSLALSLVLCASSNAFAQAAAAPAAPAAPARQTVCLELEGVACGAKKVAPECRGKSKAALATEKSRCEAGLDEDAAASDDNGTWDESTCGCKLQEMDEFCDLPDGSIGAKADGVREVHGYLECTKADLEARDRSRKAENAALRKRVVALEPLGARTKALEDGQSEALRIRADHEARIKAEEDGSSVLGAAYWGDPACSKVFSPDPGVRSAVTEAEKAACTQDKYGTKRIAEFALYDAKEAGRGVARVSGEVDELRGKVARFGLELAYNGVFTQPEATVPLASGGPLIRRGGSAHGLTLGLVITPATGWRLRAAGGGLSEEGHDSSLKTQGFWGGILKFGAAYFPWRPHESVALGVGAGYGYSASGSFYSDGRAAAHSLTVQPQLEWALDESFRLVGVLPFGWQWNATKVAGTTHKANGGTVELVLGAAYQF